MTVRLSIENPMTWARGQTRKLKRCCVLLEWKESKLPEPEKARFYPNFEGEHPGEDSGASLFSSYSIYLTRGLAARWLFRTRAPPCHEGTIHLQTSMSSNGI
ncbi:hypothetical protein TNCV_1845631 [Trichonephila clavipes]|nr:hypothetical protein TNCV_1845631 [Trichonephila clavipes]